MKIIHFHLTLILLASATYSHGSHFISEEKRQSLLQKGINNTVVTCCVEHNPKPECRHLSFFSTATPESSSTIQRAKGTIEEMFDKTAQTLTAKSKNFETNCCSNPRKLFFKYMNNGIEEVVAIEPKNQKSVTYLTIDEPGHYLITDHGVFKISSAMITDPGYRYIAPGTSLDIPLSKNSKEVWETSAYKKSGTNDDNTYSPISNAFTSVTKKDCCLQRVLLGVEALIRAQLDTDENEEKFVKEYLNKSQEPLHKIQITDLEKEVMENKIKTLTRCNTTLSIITNLLDPVAYLHNKARGA